METLVHADIFFLVTTISVGIITIGLVVVIVYVLKLLASVNGIINEIRSELKAMIDYLEDQRENSQSKLSSLAFVGEGLMRLYGSFAHSKTSKKKHSK